MGEGAGLPAGVRVGYGMGSVATGAFGTVPGLMLLPYLTDTLGITAAHNGTDLLAGASVTLSQGEPVPDALVRAGPRVGVSRAHDWQHRFYLAGDPTVSAYRLSPRAKPSAGA